MVQPTTSVRRLSADAARRIALAAQGFGRPRPSGRITRQHLRRVIATIGLIQIDSVNVLVRAQEMPLFSRLGPHPRTLIPDAVADGELFEYWSHAASLLPTEVYRLHRARMSAQSVDGWFRGFTDRKQVLIDSVLEQVRDRGPLAVSDLEGRVRNKGGTWWDWDEGKIALEALFAQGRIAATRRPRDFARLYDLPERVIPAAALNAPAPSVEQTRRELVLLAARSLGIATAADLADYYHHKVTLVRPVVAQLVAEGALIPVEVDGWAHPAVLHPEANTPRVISGHSLLSPFDPLIWTRPRTERIFGFHYRIEIYTPAHKRQYGYYTLPFLLDGHLVGRVDLKADRQSGVLRALSTWVEPDLDTPGDRADVAEHLAAELHDMARWLELGAVAAAERGNLADDLLGVNVGGTIIDRM